MSQTWFFQHGGKTQGPVSSAQLKDLARRKLVEASDLIWLEGGDPQGAIPADAALDFSTLVAEPQPATATTPVSPTLASGSVPDWLSDVAALEKPGPIPAASLPPAPAAPDYLEDLRLWMGLDVRPKPVPAAAKTAAKPAVPLAIPVSAAPETAKPETGFDMNTGRILDPEKFKKWRQRQAAGAGGSVTNGSMLEAFRKARILIETWIDDDKNRLRITHGDAEELTKHQEVTAILGRFSQYGPTMRDKLERHLQFLVENRRKYYRAAAK
jgi:hypothetical protein